MVILISSQQLSLFEIKNFIFLGDQLSWLEHLPYKQGVIGSSPISPTIFFAGIAQLVEQLTCNQQVVGSSPISGTIFMEGQRSGQTRQTVNLFLRVLWFKSISLHHYLLPRSQVVRHRTLTPAFRWFEPTRGSHSQLVRQLSRQSI